MGTRFIKQLFIGFIFLLIPALIGAVFYFILWWNKPPSKQQVVMPQEPEIIWVKIFQSDPMTYDLGAKIKNPNVEEGAPFLNYTFSLFDNNNNIIKTVNDHTYLLPDEEKYLIKNRVELVKAPVKLILSFESIDWQPLSEGQKIKEDFPIFSPRLNILKQENNFAEASGLLTNKTDYDFMSIQASIVLYDFNNEPKAVNRTELNNVHSKEERLIQFNWRNPFPENIQTLDIQARTNLFSKDNVF